MRMSTGKHNPLERRRGLFRAAAGRVPEFFGLEGDDGGVERGLEGDDVGRDGGQRVAAAAEVVPGGEDEVAQAGVMGRERLVAYVGAGLALLSALVLASARARFRRGRVTLD